MTCSERQFNPAVMSFLRDELELLRNSGLARKLPRLTGAPGPRVSVNGREVVLLCSNNYLGLAGNESVKRAAKEAIEDFGCGSTGSRLISGNSDLYERLEQDVAAFKGTEAALVFGSGYHANVGTVSALAGSGDVIFSDSLNHASLIDGCRLSRADVEIYTHCDPNDLERKLTARRGARRKLIVTESVFSMDGDCAPLKDISLLAEKHSAMLMVDEAHATGVLGPSVAGLIEHMGLSARIPVQMGTFSKALGSVGLYIAASKDLIRYLLHHARSFVFTTGLPPAAVAASRAAVAIVKTQPELREALWRNVRRLRDGLLELGFRIAQSESHIIPLGLEDDRLTMAACRLLLRNRVFAQGIRPPTVPPGTSRLRLTPMALHGERDIRETLASFAKLRSALERRLVQRQMLTVR